MNLLDKISNPKSLYNAWGKLNKSNPESHGVSGITIEKFGQNKDERIGSISEQLKKNKFSFSPTRAVTIKKSNGSLRPLQIPEIQDRVVIKAIAIELENIFSKELEDFRDVSFAYQKNLGVKDAIMKMKHLYSEGYTVILKADINNFFSEVNKEELLDKYIYPKLGEDISINGLIKAALNQKISGIESLAPTEAEIFMDIEKGIPQGNALSPLFSNIYLNPFDQFMIHKKYQVIRYADDFIVMCKTEAGAKNSFNDAKFFLGKLGLELHAIGSEKTKIVSPENQEFSFLSIEFDGHHLLPSKEKVESLKNRIRSACNIPTDEINVLELLIKIKNRFEGWVSAFHFTHLEFFSKEIDYFINRQLYLSLRSFKWNLSKNSIDKAPKKYTKWSGGRECISAKQRKFSGIAFTNNLLLKMRK